MMNQLCVRRNRVVIFAIFAALLLVGCSAGTSLRTQPALVKLFPEESTPSQDGLHELQAEFIEHKIIIDVMINGTGPHRMILDTGGAICQISKPIAKESEISTRGWVRTRDAHGGMNQERVGNAAVMQIGPINAYGVPITIDDLPDQIAADGNIIGVLGYNIFTKHTLVIDYPAKRLFISDRRLAYVAQGTVPLRIDQGNPYIETEMILGEKKRGMLISMLLDTGSDGLIVLAGLNASVYADTSSTLQQGASMSASGSIMPVNYARMNFDMDLGGVHASRLMAIIEPELPHDHTSLGGDFMRRFRVSIDPVAKRARFELPEGALKILMPVWMGHGFVMDATPEDQAIVREVIKGSAAESGGLQAGDVIVALDGRPLSIEPFHWPTPVLNNSAKSRVFTVLRDGESIELALEFQELIAEPQIYRMIRAKRMSKTQEASAAVESNTQSAGSTPQPPPAPSGSEL